MKTPTKVIKPIPCQKPEIQAPVHLDKPADAIMPIEEEKENIDPKINYKKNHKPKPVYNLNDEEIRSLMIDKDLFARLISNNNGYFVDIRKYFNGYPTQKGVRLHLTTFRQLYDLFKEDIDKILPQNIK